MHDIRFVRALNRILLALAVVAMMADLSPARATDAGNRAPALTLRAAARATHVHLRGNFLQRGEGRILLRFNDLLKDFHVHVILATDKIIAARPEAIWV